MDTGMTTNLPSSLSGSESESPELTEKTRKLDDAIAAFIAAGNEFLAAGGDQFVLMGKFQAAMMGEAPQT